jgi:hypothetical protein
MPSPVGDAPRDKLRTAVALARSGDWQGGHLIAQDYEGDPIANWIHGIVHRMEGDLANARYWYDRCGRTLDVAVTTDSELAEVAKALGQGD